MSGVQPFQFEPTYPPGEEPTESDEESEGVDAEVSLCCQELEELNQKFDETGLFPFVW